MPLKLYFKHLQMSQREKSNPNKIEDSSKLERFKPSRSGTHECTPKRFFQPESVGELEKIVAAAHNKGVSPTDTAFIRKINLYGSEDLESSS